MLDITTFQNFGEGEDGWSYRGHGNARRALGSTVALLVFASDLDGWDGKYGTETRETHVRSVEVTEHGHRLSAPIRLDAPLTAAHLEVRILCVEIDGEVDAGALLDDAARGYELSIGGQQPRPWHDPFPAFGSPQWTPESTTCRTLFEDCWSVSTANPMVGGREPLQAGHPTDSTESISRHLARRNVTRLISFDSDGHTSRERRRYQNRVEGTDCALGMIYSG